MSPAWVGVAAGITLLAWSGRAAAAQTLSQRDALDPPRVAGITLGDSMPAVLRALGAPDHRQESLGFRFWDYRRRGLSVTWDKTDGRVHVIVVADAGAGAVAGVRVGDPVATVRAQWGTAARLRDHGRFMDFIRRGWTCTADVRHGRVTEITLTLVA